MTLNLKSRVIILVSISFALFLVVAIATCIADWHKAKSYQESLANLDLVSKTSKLIGKLQVERGTSAAYLKGGVDFSILEERRRAVDTESPAVRDALELALISDAQKGKLRRTIGQIKDSRKIVDDKGEVSTALKNYNKKVSSLLMVNKYVADGTSIAEFSAQMRSLQF